MTADTGESGGESDGLRLAAEAVFQGVDLAALAHAPIIDTTTTCPTCGHGEAVMGIGAPDGGFFEMCCACGTEFVDPTP